MLGEAPGLDSDAEAWGRVIDGLDVLYDLAVGDALSSGFEPDRMTRVLPEGARGRLVEASVASARGLTGVLTLTEVEIGGERQAHLQLFAEGQRAFVCPLPAPARLWAAVFDEGRLFALVVRGDAARDLAYDAAAFLRSGECRR